MLLLSQNVTVRSDWSASRAYITEKTSCCFNHRVVTTVADKLKRQWLWKVCFGTRN